MDEDVRFSEVAERVNAALAEDERTVDYNIQVIDKNGLVTLKGDVPSVEVAAAAQEIAEEQEGVITAVNAMEVVPELEEGEGIEPVIPVPPTNRPDGGPRPL